MYSQDENTKNIKIYMPTIYVLAAIIFLKGTIIKFRILTDISRRLKVMSNSNLECQGELIIKNGFIKKAV